MRFSAFAALSRTKAFFASILAAAFLAAAPASAGVGGAAGPTWPPVLAVGDPVSAYIDIVNASDGINATENVDILLITFTPSCAAASVGQCTTPDPGVFNLTSVAIGDPQSSCKNTFFTLVGPSPLGIYTLSPNQAIHLGPADGSGGLANPRNCRIVLAGVVTRKPVDSTPPNPPVTTIQFARAILRGAVSQSVGAAVGQATVAITSIADLVIAKTDGQLSVEANASTTYTVTVTNNGPSPADGAIVKDPLVAGLNKTAAACTGATGGAACPVSTTTALLEGAGVVIPTLPKNGTVTFTVTATVTAAGGTVKNSASVTPPSGTNNPGTSCTTLPDPNSRGFSGGVCTAGDLDTVGLVTDLLIGKTDGVSSINAGASTTYTVTVTNSGPSPADGAIVKDPLAAGLNKTAAACTGATGGAVCPVTTTALLEGAGVVIPTFPSGATVTFTVTATVTAASGTVKNLASVAPPAGATNPGTSCTAQPDPLSRSFSGGICTAGDLDNVAVVTDLLIAKTDGVSAVNAGGSTTYTVTVTNSGPSPADGAIVKDPLAAGLNKTAAACTGATGGAVCPVTTTALLEGAGVVIPTFPSGATVTFTVTATVTAASGTVKNLASVTPPAGATNPGTSCTAQPDPLSRSFDAGTGTCTAGDLDNVTPVSTLTASKTDNATTYTPGGQTVYTIVVGNTGPSDAIGAVVTDAKPSQVTTWTWVCGAPTGGATGCDGAASGSANFSDTVNLPVGSTITYTVTALIAAGATGDLVNSVTVTPPGAGTPATATDTDTPAPASTLTASKTDNAATYTPGGQTVYTIVVGNTGPSDAIGAVVTDAKPSQVTTWTWVCGAPTGGATGCDGAASGSANFSDTVNLPVGSTITYTVTALIAAGATGDLVNSVTVTPQAGTPATATDTDTPAPASTLTASKTDNAATYTPGGQTVYTIVVGNTGPSDAIGAVVTDTKPSQVTSWTWVCGAPTGGATGCDGAASGSANFSDTVNLPVGSTITYTVTALIAAGATGDLVNSVTVTPQAGTPATATDTDTPAPASTLTASKTDNAATYTPGGQTVYTIVVGNTGPSDAIGAVVTDTKPSQVTSWTWVCGAPTGGATGCDGAASGSANFSDTVNLPVGSTITYTVTALIAAGATGNLVNSVTVTPQAGTPATATDTDTPAPASTLTASKTDNAATYLPGGQTVYTIVVGNTGPSDAIGAVVTDTKPSQVTTWTWVCGAPTGGATGCDGAASGSANFSDTVNLPVGSTITYTVTAQIAAGATGNLVNSVTVTPQAGTPATATDTDTPAPVSNLTASKTDGVTQYPPGGQTVYTIVVGNSGPSDAIGAVVTDTKPSQVTTWTWVCGAPTGGATGCDGAASGSSNFSDTVNLPVGSTITYTVTAQISAGATGNLVNTVTVTPPAGGTPGTATDTDTPAPVVNGLIAHTSTTCSDYVNHVAGIELPEIFYTGAVNIGQNVNPGVFFYFATFTTTVPNQVVTVTQSHTGTVANFVSTGQDKLFTANCASSIDGTDTPGGFGATWTVPLPGTYVVQIKYDSKSIAGTPVPVPETVTYTFTTSGDPLTIGTVVLTR